MQRQKVRDTGCELAVRRLLHGAGIRYRVDFRPLQGERFRADIGWKGRKIAVFIDGCFWHGCPTHGTLPKSNTDWWRNKFEANRARDERANTALAAAGWTVLRYWEHESPDKIVEDIIGRAGLMARK